MFFSKPRHQLAARSLFLMLGNQQAYKVAQDIADGTGEWGSLPLRLRESITVALIRALDRDVELQPSSVVAHAPHTRVPPQAFTTRGTPLPGKVDPRKVPGPSPRSPHAGDVLSSSPPMPAYLTQPMIERYVETFEDARWMRAQSVRSFAQWHNTVESLETSMGSHINALLRASIPLNEEYMKFFRHQLQLKRTDRIPDGVTIEEQWMEEAIGSQMALLESMRATVHELRMKSVQFAAEFLTDEEKLLLGAHPAYLRSRERSGSGGVEGTPKHNSLYPRRRSSPVRSPAAPPSNSPTPRAFAKASHECCLRGEESARKFATDISSIPTPGAYRVPPAASSPKVRRNDVVSTHSTPQPPRNPLQKKRKDEESMVDEQTIAWLMKRLEAQASALEKDLPSGGKESKEKPPMRERGVNRGGMEEALTN